MNLNETMPNWLKKRAFLTPNRPAVVFQGKTTTFKELYDKAYHMAGQLNASGLAKDQFVGLLAKKSHRFCPYFTGTSTIGCTSRYSE